MAGKNAYNEKVIPISCWFQLCIFWVSNMKMLYEIYFLLFCLVGSITYFLLYNEHNWNEWVDYEETPFKDWRDTIQMVCAYTKVNADM